MPFHPAVGAGYRGGLPAGAAPPISFGHDPSDKEIAEAFVHETLRVLDVFGVRPGEPPGPRAFCHGPGCSSAFPRDFVPPPQVPVAVVGLGLAAVAALIFVALK